MQLKKKYRHKMGEKFSGNHNLLTSPETEKETFPMLTVTEILYLRQLIFERNKLTYVDTVGDKISQNIEFLNKF